MNLRGKIYYAEASLTSGTTYNVFAIGSPANQRITIEGFGWFGAANAAQTPGQLVFNRNTGIGTSGSSLTPHPLNEDQSETFQGTYKTNVTLTTGFTEIDERLVNPQIGLTEYFPGPLAYEMKGNSFFIVQFTPQWTGNYNGWLLIAE